MPKDAHMKAAEHHDNAAKSHRMAAGHHGMGEHDKGREESSRPRLIQRLCENIPKWPKARATPRNNQQDQFRRGGSASSILLARGLPRAPNDRQGFWAGRQRMLRCPTLDWSGA